MGMLEEEILYQKIKAGDNVIEDIDESIIPV